MDWNPTNVVCWWCCKCRTLCGCVDWNILTFIKIWSILSRTLCGCVDWNLVQVLCLLVRCVAPYVGAWIETYQAHLSKTGFDGRTLCGCVDWNWGYGKEDHVHRLSHPMWVRGLKLNLLNLIKHILQSHPMWVRGLKRESCVEWIGAETLSHPMWVRGLKLSLEIHSFLILLSHPMWVRGLKPLQFIELSHRLQSRTLCGCVDWNILMA